MLTQNQTTLSIHFVAGVVVVLLLVAMFGLTYDWSFVRHALSIGLFLLALLAFKLHYHEEGISLLVATALFSPFFFVTLPRHIWVITDILTLTGVIIFAIWSTNSHQKGNRFEEYVTNLFPEPDFIMLDRTRDISKFSNRKVESDSHPDLVFRSMRTGQTFAIECKWRSKWWDDNGEKGILWKQWFTSVYTKFQAERNIPVWIALGVGGTPQKPKDIYFLPLSTFKKTFIPKSVITNGRNIDAMQNATTY